MLDIYARTGAGASIRIIAASTGNKVLNTARVAAVGKLSKVKVKAACYRLFVTLSHC